MAYSFPGLISILSTLFLDLPFPFSDRKCVRHRRVESGQTQPECLEPSVAYNGFSNEKYESEYEDIFR